MVHFLSPGILRVEEGPVKQRMSEMSVLSPCPLRHCTKTNIPEQAFLCSHCYRNVKQILLLHLEIAIPYRLQETTRRSFAGSCEIKTCISLHLRHRTIPSRSAVTVPAMTLSTVSLTQLAL